MPHSVYGSHKVFEDWRGFSYQRQTKNAVLGPTEGKRCVNLRPSPLFLSLSTLQSARHCAWVPYETWEARFFSNTWLPGSLYVLITLFTLCNLREFAPLKSCFEGSAMTGYLLRLGTRSLVTHSVLSPLFPETFSSHYSGAACIFLVHCLKFRMHFYVEA